MIRAQPLGDVWQVLGQDILRGVYPSEVVPTWGPAGPESLGFTLYRNPARVHAELLPYTPVEWYPGDDATGEPLWAGYTQQAPPGGTGDVAATNVSCVGWHYAREDKPRPALWVHSDLSAWQDIRSWRDAYLTQFTTAGQVQVGDGVALLTWPNATVMSTDMSVGVYFDCGPDPSCWPLWLSIDYEWVTASTGAALNVRVANNPQLFTTGGGGVSGTTFNVVGASPVTGAASGTGTLTGAPATARRYVGLFFTRTGGGATTGGDYGVRIRGARLFRSSAYASSGASAVIASQVVKDSRDTLTPFLSADNSRITATVLTLPHVAWIDQDATQREMSEAVNGYHGYRLGVDASRRLFFQPQPSLPRLQVDAADLRVEYVPTSTNDGSEVYNEVSVRGQSGSGEDLRVDLTLADLPASAGRDIIGLRGRERSFTLNCSAKTDTVSMEALGEAWLLAHRSTPHKANLVVQGPAVTDLQAGLTVAAEHLGRYYGEMIRVLSVVDPDTGALQSRDGIIASIQGSDPCSIAIDTERRSLEALMARMGVVHA